MRGMCVCTVSLHMACYFIGVRVHLLMGVCVQKSDGAVILEGTCVFIGLWGIISMGVVCVCVCLHCQYTNSGLQLCALVYSITCFCTEQFVFVL